MSTMEHAFALIRDALTIRGMDFDTANLHASQIAARMHYEGLLAPQVGDS